MKEQNQIAEKFIKLLGIRTPSAEQEIQYLSGGNQQKVLLSRWLATQPRFLILMSRHAVLMSVHTPKLFV